jgi:hypothetical protein
VRGSRPTAKARSLLPKRPERPPGNSIMPLIGRASLGCGQTGHARERRLGRPSGRSCQSSAEGTEQAEQLAVQVAREMSRCSRSQATPRGRNPGSARATDRRSHAHIRKSAVQCARRDSTPNLLIRANHAYCEVLNEICAVQPTGRANRTRNSQMLSVRRPRALYGARPRLALGGVASLRQPKTGRAANRGLRRSGRSK